MRVIEVPIPIYQGYMRIVIAKDFVKALERLKIDDEGYDVNSFGAFVTTSKGKHGVSIYNVFLNKNIDHDLLAHEVVHLVNAIYVERHMKLDLLNDEPQAYMTGWITGQIYKALKK